MKDLVIKYERKNYRVKFTLEEDENESEPIVSAYVKEIYEIKNGKEKIVTLSLADQTEIEILLADKFNTDFDNLTLNYTH